MLNKYTSGHILLMLFLAGVTSGEGIQMTPFPIDWRDNTSSLIDLSFLLDAPAGKNGFIRINDGHLAKSNGERFRIWGVNVTVASCFPSKENAPVVAQHLARFGINCVRFHFLDSNRSASLFVEGRDDTRQLDPQQLERLDFFVAELKKRGIYTNLNLNVGRNFRKGDGVRDHEYLGLAKVVNYFDEHIQALHRQYACEGIPILAAYSAFHDWDGIFFYTFEHAAPEKWHAKIPGHFDIRPDPVKMTSLAACALMFLRGDVRPALETIPRSYTAEQVREGIRSPYSEGSYFTSGFSPSLALRHTTRIAGFDEPAGRYPEAGPDGPIVCDTGELTWHHWQRKKGLVTVETERSQALIGFVKDNNKTLKNLSATVENDFCAIILTSLDAEPISRSQRLLLVAAGRSANSGMTWNQDRTSLSDWGNTPTVIEPVKGKVTLRNLEPSQRIEVIALDGAGKAMGDPVTAGGARREFVLNVGEQATTWYLVKIQR